MGGSIRVPAALCGVVGFKPGRQQFGDRPEKSGWDTDGVIGMSVAGVASFAHSVGWVANGSPTHFTDLRVSVVTDSVSRLAPLDPRISAVVDEAARDLSRLGCDTIYATPKPFTDYDVFTQSTAPLVTSWFAADIEAHQRELGGAFDVSALEPASAMMLEMGRGIGPSTYAAAEQWVQMSSKPWDSFWKKTNFLLTPVTPTTAPPLGWYDDPTTAIPRTLAMLQYTSWFNATGNPAIAIPRAVVDGLPVGVQLVGRHGSEAELLALAEAIADPSLPSRSNHT